MRRQFFIIFFVYCRIIAQKEGAVMGNQKRGKHKLSSQATGRYRVIL